MRMCMALIIAGNTGMFDCVWDKAMSYFHFRPTLFAPN